MSKTKYSFVQLKSIKSDIEQFFELEDKISFDLAYALNKNKRIITSELETLKEKFKDGVKDLDAYRKEVHAKLADCGAEKKMNPQGSTYLTGMENVDVKKYEAEIEKLDKKFEKELAEQEKINKENTELAKKEVATVDFFMIDKSDFPKEVNPKVFTDNIALLIKDSE